MNLIQKVFRKWARVKPVVAHEALRLDARGWVRLAATARSEGVAGLVFRSLTLAGPTLDLPPSALETLRKAAFDQAAAHSWEQRVIALILHSLHEAGVRVIVLRGHALVEDLYGGDGSLRPQVDHDILVEPGRIDDAARVMESMGFERDSSGTCLYWKDRSLVDLHEDPYDRGRVPSRGILLRAETTDVFARARPATLGGVPLLRPSPIDRLLILCAHTVKHSFDRLIRLVDIAECWQSESWDLAALRDQSRAEGSSDVLYYGLAAARARLGAQVPDHLLEELRPRQRTIADRLFDGYLQGRPSPLLAEWHLLGRLKYSTTRARALGEMIRPQEGSGAAATRGPAGRLAAASLRAARLAAGAAGSVTLAALPRKGTPIH